jgi:xylono-1,5-lactonase
MDKFAVVTHQQDSLGEGPTWVASQQSLFWVDIIQQRLHRYRTQDGCTYSWDMPEQLCWLVERQDRTDFLAGFASGIASLSLDPVVIQRMHTLEPDKTDHRLNDAKVDPLGRLWAGTMHIAAATPTGSLYRIEAGRAPVRVDKDYCVPNGPAFSPAGDLLYHADSLRRVVYRFAVAPDGSLQEKSDYICFADEWGLPDGMTVDEEGHLWVAHWDGSRISRFDPDGNLDRSVTLPASRITSCAFGGDKLERMFITSARMECEHEALAGALFEIDPGTKGIAPCTFIG